MICHPVGATILRDPQLPQAHTDASSIDQLCLAMSWGTLENFNTLRQDFAKATLITMSAPDHVLEILVASRQAKAKATLIAMFPFGSGGAIQPAFYFGGI